MDRVSGFISARIPINLKANFKARVEHLGFSISEAVKSMIQDLVNGKITLTKYPYLDSRRKHHPPKPKRPTGRPPKYPPRENGTRLVGGRK